MERIPKVRWRLDYSLVTLECLNGWRQQGSWSLDQQYHLKTCYEWKFSDPTPAKSVNLGWGPNNLHFDMPSRGIWCRKVRISALGYLFSPKGGHCWRSLEQRSCLWKAWDSLQEEMSFLLETLGERVYSDCCLCVYSIICIIEETLKLLTLLLLVQFSHSVVSNSLRPHGLHHTRPPCPSPTPGVYSNSCPLSWWCHPTISSSPPTFNLSQHQGLFKWVSS